jgi:hypothetical protein
VYLLIKNLRIKRLIKKLDKVKVRLFFISKQISLVNFQLKLLKDIKIYLVFYILLLEPTNAKILV